MSEAPNPYLSSQTTGATRNRSLLSVVSWWFGFLYPLITIGCIYMCWAVTAFSIGRPPEFGEGATNDIAASVAYLIGSLGALLFIMGPVLVPLGFVFAGLFPFASRPGEASDKERVNCLVLYGVLFGVAGCLWIFDPVGAIDWYWD